MSQDRDAIPEPAEHDDLFVAFANTLELDRGEPIDAIPDADALLAWLRAHGLLSERGRAAETGRLRRDAAEAERRLERFRLLRHLIHAIAARTSEDRPLSTGQVRDVNHILRHGVHYHQLRLDADRTRYGLAQIGDRLDQARATIAGGLARFLAEEDADRLRACANDGLPLPVHRPLPDRPPTLVRHAHLRQPGEGGPPPGEGARWDAPRRATNRFPRRRQRTRMGAAPSPTGGRGANHASRRTTAASMDAGPSKPERTRVTRRPEEPTAS